MRFGERLQRLVSERSNRRPGEDGFTLIELLVVIVILAILAAVVVFAVGGVGDKGASAAAKQDVRTLRTAEEAHLARHGRYATEAELVSAGLLGEQSQKHDIVLIGDPGPNQSYRITSPPQFASEQAGDGSVPVGGVIKVAGGTDVTTPNAWLNPAVTSGGGVHPNVEYMFNGLLRWAENNTAQPDLAQSYTISPDQKTYTFTLRPGIQFHNGTTLTSTDVKFSFEEALLKFHGRTSASVGPALGVTGVGSAATTPVGAITTPNTSTAAFNFIYAYAPFLRQLNVTESPIIPENVYGACAYPPYPGGAGTINGAGCPGNNPGSGDFPTPTTVGSGPFKLKSRNTLTGALVFVKHSPYHLPGLPFADEIQQVPTANAADALTANPPTIHVGSPANNRVLPIVAPQTSADITPANGFTLFQPPRGPGGGNCILTEAFNLWKRGDTPATINAKPANAPYEHPIFGDPTSIPANPGAGRPNPMPRGQVVRTALAMATDRQTLFNTNQFGKGRLATSPFHSAVPGYITTSLPAYDLTKADQWLDDAGWSDATTPRQFTGTVIPGVTPAANAPFAWTLVAGQGGQTTYGNTIATQWGSGGPIKANMTVSSQTNGVISNTRFNDRDYDMITVSYCNGDEPIIGVRRQFYAGTAPGATAPSQISGTGFTNASGYRTTTMDAAWDSAIQGNTSAYASIQNEATATMPAIWLDESLGSRAWITAKCAGFNNYNTGLFVETAGCSA